jgi:hypothetical protein
MPVPNIIGYVRFRRHSKADWIRRSPRVLGYWLLCEPLTALKLLAKQEAYTGVETVGPPARQWRLLKRRTPPALYWLLQQMTAWPRRYIRHQWMDLNSILALYH